MKEIKFVFLLFLVDLICTTSLLAQGVGIGTNTPNHKLDVLGGNTSLDKYVLIKDFDDLTEFTRLISRDNSLMGWRGGWVVGQYPNGGIPTGFGLTGTLLSKGQSAFAVTSGNVGIGVLTPEQKLDVRGNAIQWGNRSLLGTDQGGSLELGGNATVAGTGSPFIDFHFNGLTQDFNTRIINNGDGVLTFFASDRAIFSNDIRMAGIGSSITNTTVITQNGTGDLAQRTLPANVWDGDDNTTYIAGLGMTLTGTTFSSDLGTSIESAEITNGTVVAADLNSMGATANQVLTWNGSAWTPVTPDKTILSDLDDDTKIYVEKNPDEDIIRFDLEGIERMRLTETTGGQPRLDFNFNGIRIGALAGNAGIQSTGVMVGIRAGENNTGSFNNFLGYHAGRLNTTGQSNVFVGTYAGTSNTTGGLNTFVGSYNGRFNTSGQRNVFVGASAGERNTFANENTFVGTSAGQNTNTGGFNTFIGSSAGQNNTSGSGNIFIGRQAGLNSQNTIRNTFVGMQVGSLNTTGNFNTFIGGEAGYGNTTGYQNTFVGQGSGANSTTGYENVMLGYQAGSANAGNGNVFIGNQAGRAETGSEKLYIDNNSTATPLIYGDFANNSLIFYGSVTIGGNYLLPIADGINGQVMTTDGAGNATWSTTSTVFERDAVNGEIQPSGAVTIATDNFVFGSTQLNNLAGGQDNARFFFDKSKGAFRAGTVSGTQWDAVNVGTGSIGLGNEVLASGLYTVAVGNNITSVGQYAIGVGSNLTMNGVFSMSLGYNNINSSDYSITFGRNNTAMLQSMAGGTGNTANGNYALAWGGTQNESVGFANTIIGGYQNKIRNTPTNLNTGYNSITGGRDNQIDSTSYSFIGNGESNVIENTGSFQNTKFYTAIVGGKSNRVTYTANNNFEPSNFIGAGQRNILSESNYSSVVGGVLNRIDNSSTSIVVGGEENRIESTNHAGILTGDQNHILQSSQAIITGGFRNFEQNSSNAFIGSGSFDSILISAHSNIIGGLSNKIGSSSYATIAGGRNNSIGVTNLGTYSFIAGGSHNVVNSQRSVSLGSYTNTNSNNGCFIFGDNSTTTATNNTVANQFMVRAAGGTVFYTNAGLTSGVQLASGAGAWATVSDKNKKENFERVEGETVLSKISNMEIKAWNYIAQGANIRHLGPTAQDFYTAFELGESDTTITTVDIDGINLLAIQTLEKRTKELQVQNEQFAKLLAIQTKEMEVLKKMLKQPVEDIKELAKKEK